VAAMRALETPRLTLEPQTAAHADDMFVVLGDPAIYEFENEPPRSLEWLRQRFTKLESRQSADGGEQWLNWVIRVPGCGLIGYVQATLRRDGSATIAYELASAYWGRGFASEALRAMIDELFARYDVRELSAVLKGANGRSLRLLERLGFALAPPAMRTKRRIDVDELLMSRRLG